MRYRVKQNISWHYTGDMGLVGGGRTGGQILAPNYIFLEGDIVSANSTIFERDWSKPGDVQMEGIYVKSTLSGSITDIDNSKLVLDENCGMRSYCKGSLGCFIPLDMLEPVTTGSLPDVNKPDVVTAGTGGIQVDKKSGLVFLGALVIIGLVVWYKEFKYLFRK
uniref:Uncharacterized protein n=1 Tax=viral metagenome TaxID=1070528 RepID=A0A6M3K2V9_9ZZZZ